MFLKCKTPLNFFLILQNEAIIWSFQNAACCGWVSVVSVAVSAAGAASSIIK